MFVKQYFILYIRKKNMDFWVDISYSTDEEFDIIKRLCEHVEWVVQSEKEIFFDIKNQNYAPYDILLFSDGKLSLTHKDWISLRKGDKKSITWVIDSFRGEHLEMISKNKGLNPNEKAEALLKEYADMGLDLPTSKKVIENLINHLIMENPTLSDWWLYVLKKIKEK